MDTLFWVSERFLFDGDASQRAHSRQISRIERLCFGHQVRAVLGNCLDADVQFDRDMLVG
jgi:hypothetical protein